jgi:hypothetical protein
MAKMTPQQEAAYALDFNASRDSLKPDVQVEYDRMKAERARGVARSTRSAAPAAHTIAKQERTPPGVLVLGVLLGWGPWSAAIGAWQAFGNSGYTINGQSASTSAAHGLCQAGQAALQPGICGSIDDHYTFGVAMLVIGALAFVGGMIGLFSAQQRNPRAWRQAGGPIFAGLVLGIFAVVVVIIVAIVRSVQESATGPSTVPAQAANTAASPQFSEQSNRVTATSRQVDVQWRVSADGGWEWLASDGQWYSQQLAPAGLLPPAPPPPATQYWEGH